MVLLPLLFAAATATADLTLLAPGGDLAETSLAISGTRIVLATMAHTAPAPVKIFVSQDSGISWSQTADRELSIGGKTYSYAGDPTVVTLDDGSFGLAYIVNSQTVPRGPGDMALVYERSADGVTWSPPLVIDSGPIFGSLAVDKPTLDVDRVRGTVYLAWTHADFPTVQNVIATSTDRGATWSGRRIVSSSESSAQPVLTTDGTLVVTSVDFTSGSFLSRVSKDERLTFSDPLVFGTDADTYQIPPTNTRSWPMQSTIAFRDDVYCAFPTRHGVFFARTRDGGKTWSAPLQLGGATGYAIMPSLAVDDASGAIVVSWLDSRDDVSNATFRLYAAQSLDGGASFQSPVAFSAPFAGGATMGDYNSGLAIRKGLVVTTFAPAGGYLTVARLDFAPPAPRRRAARH